MKKINPQQLGTLLNEALNLSLKPLFPNLLTYRSSPNFSGIKNNEYFVANLSIQGDLSGSLALQLSQRSSQALMTHFAGTKIASKDETINGIKKLIKTLGKGIQIFAHERKKSIETGAPQVHQTQDNTLGAVIESVQDTPWACVPTHVNDCRIESYLTLDHIKPKTSNRILIMEDDPSTSKLLKLIFEKSGYDTLSAKDGAEGLMMAASHKCDLAVVDMKMPNIDGATAIKALKITQPNLPVIVNSSFARQKVKQLLDQQSQRAKAIITKPIDRDELLLLTRVILEEVNSRNKVGKEDLVAC